MYMRRMVRCGAWITLSVLLILTLLCACGNNGAGNTTSPPGESFSPPPTGGNAADIDNSETGIGVIYQEYEGDDIVEILMISYDGQQEALEEFGGKNPEIEMINNEIKAGPLALYQNYQENAVEGDSIDIRSYPFVDDEYIQIITTATVYPEVVPEQNTRLWSYNFSKTENRYISVEEQMGEYGLTQESVSEQLKEIVDDPDSGSVFSVEITGFFIDSASGQAVTHFLLEVMHEMESDPFKVFCMYTPDSGEFEELSSELLLDPDRYDLYEMDPTLCCNDYGRHEEEWPELLLTMDTSGLDELSPDFEYMLDGMVYFCLESYTATTDSMFDAETLVEYIQMLEFDDIRVESVELSEEISTLLTYPAWLVVYKTGENEDTSHCVDLVFQTDSAEYRLHTSVPVDFAEEYGEEIDRRLTSAFLTDSVG